MTYIFLPIMSMMRSSKLELKSEHTIHEKRLYCQFGVNFWCKISLLTSFQKNKIEESLRVFVNGLF